LVYGIGSGIAMPSSSVLTIDLVGKQSLSDATAIRRITMTIMGFIGPALIAILINVTGIGPFYFLMGAIYCINVVAISLIKISKSRTPSHQSPLKELLEGLRFHKNNRDVTSLQLIALIANVFIFPMVPDLLVPIIAKDILRVGASGYSWLSAALNFGRLGGALCVLPLGNSKKKGLFTAFNSLLWGPCLWLFSSSKWYPFSLILIFFFGIMMTITITMIEILLLINSPPEMRGRVMGVRSQVVMCEFIMNLVWGPALPIIGASLSGQINSILFTISMIAIIIWAPTLRKMK
jgi:hypothetical protein